MRKLVVDTNCLLQLFPRRSPYRTIFNNILLGKYSLCLSTEVINEYLEIICQQTTPAIAKKIVEIISNLPNTQFYNPQYRFGLITIDPDDNKFVDLAIIAGADYLVSNDRHFNEAAQSIWPHINIIKLKDFAKIDSIL